MVPSCEDSPRLDADHSAHPVAEHSAPRVAEHSAPSVAEHSAPHVAEPSNLHVADEASWLCARTVEVMTQKASFTGNQQITKKTNKPKNKTKKKQTNKKNKQIHKNNKNTIKKTKTINSARFETQRDFVLLPNRRSLLIPLALKVHSLLRCLLPSCDQDSQNPTRAA